MLCKLNCAVSWYVGANEERDIVSWHLMKYEGRFSLKMFRSQRVIVSVCKEIFNILLEVTGD
jgi:hypothetical protein